MWLVNQMTKNVFVLELERLQEECQRREAEEKENRQVEIQRSTVRSRRGRRQQELGESVNSQQLQNFQEGAKVSLHWPVSYWSMLVETLICPLTIFLCPQIRGERDETPVSPLTSSMPNRKNVPKTTRRKRKSCQLEVRVCVCVPSVCAFQFDC